MTPEEYIRTHPEDTEYAKAYSAKMSHAAPAVPGSPTAIPDAISENRPPERPVAPPEYHAPSRLGHPGLVDALPHFLGGGTQMWQEPSLAAFRLRTGLRDKGIDSQEYQHFADDEWNAAVNEAERQKRSVVRISKAKNDTLGNTVRNEVSDAVTSAPGAALGGALGRLDLFSGGLGTRALPALAERAGLAPKGTKDLVSDVMEEHPAAGLAGSFGAGGLPKLAAEATEHLGPGISGALTGAAAAAAERASEKGGEAALGRHPTLDVGDLMTPGLAAIMGAGAGKLGQGAQALQDSLRSDVHPMGKELRTLEAGGGKLHTLFPLVEPSPGMTDSLKTASKGGPEGVRFATDVAREKTVPGLTKAVMDRARTLDSEWNDPFEGFLPKYLGTPEGKVALPPTNLGNALKEIISTRTYPGTAGKIPFTARSEFKNALNDAFDVSEPVAPKKVPKGVQTISIDEARNQGFVVPDAPGNHRVALTLKKMDAKRFEAMMGDLSVLAKEGTSAMPPETYKKLVAAAREDRDAYPWPASLGEEPTATTPDNVTTRGFSAKHTEWSQKKAALDKLLGDAGITVGREPDPGAIEKAVRSASGGYGREGQSGLTKALYELAQHDEGLAQQLKEIPAIDAATFLSGKGGIQTSRRGVVSNLRLRADPIAASVAKNAPKLGAPAASALSSPAFKKLVLGLYQ